MSITEIRGVPPEIMTDDKSDSSDKTDPTGVALEIVEALSIEVTDISQMGVTKKTK